MNLSIVIPAKNEAITIGAIVRRLREVYPDAEVIVVNDASSDNTAEVARESGAKVITQPYSKGNGASIKTGARHASNEVLVFMDGDCVAHPDFVREHLRAAAPGRRNRGAAHSAGPALETAAPIPR